MAEQIEGKIFILTEGARQKIKDASGVDISPQVGAMTVEDAKAAIERNYGVKLTAASLKEQEQA